MYLYLQSDGHSNGNINSLDLYLLVSLFFVIATMVEFAIVLVISRISRNRHRGILARSTTQGKRTSYNMKNIMAETVDQLLLPINNIEPKSSIVLNDDMCSQVTHQNHYSSTDIIDFSTFLVFFSSYILFNFAYFSYSV